MTLTPEKHDEYLKKLGIDYNTSNLPNEKILYLIREAYKKQALLTHPDRTTFRKDLGEVRVNFRDINQAYEELLTWYKQEKDKEKDLSSQDKSKSPNEYELSYQNTMKNLDEELKREYEKYKKEYTKSRKNIPTEKSPSPKVYSQNPIEAYTTLQHGQNTKLNSTLLPLLQQHITQGPETQYDDAAAINLEKLESQKRTELEKEYIQTLANLTTEMHKAQQINLEKLESQKRTELEKEYIQTLANLTTEMHKAQQINLEKLESQKRTEFKQIENEELIKLEQSQQMQLMQLANLHQQKELTKQQEKEYKHLSAVEDLAFNRLNTIEQHAKEELSLRDDIKKLEDKDRSKLNQQLARLIIAEDEFTLREKIKTTRTTDIQELGQKLHEELTKLQQLKQIESIQKEQAASRKLLNENQELERKILTRSSLGFAQTIFRDDLSKQEQSTKHLMLIENNTSRLINSTTEKYPNLIQKIESNIKELLTDPATLHPDELKDQKHPKDQTSPQFLSKEFIAQHVANILKLSSEINTSTELKKIKDYKKNLEDLALDVLYEEEGQKQYNLLKKTGTNILKLENNIARIDSFMEKTAPKLRLNLQNTLADELSSELSNESQNYLKQLTSNDNAANILQQIREFIQKTYKSKGNIQDKSQAQQQSDTRETINNFFEKILIPDGMPEELKSILKDKQENLKKELAKTTIKLLDNLDPLYNLEPLPVQSFDNTSDQNKPKRHNNSPT